MPACRNRALLMQHFASDAVVAFLCTMSIIYTLTDHMGFACLLWVSMHDAQNIQAMYRDDCLFEVLLAV